jgi:hypothetical protein
MLKIFNIAAIMLCLLLCGCARRAMHVEFLVGAECHPEARLVGCDGESPPRHCKQIKLKFDKNCEKLAVGH